MQTTFANHSTYCLLRRYDEPSTTFQTALLGSPEAPKKRDIAAPTLTTNGSLPASVPPSIATNHTADCNGGGCTFEAWGMTTKPTKTPTGDVLAIFDDKTPAVVSNTVGKGKSVHFYFFPGTSRLEGYAGAPGTASQWTLTGLLYNVTCELGAGSAPAASSSLNVETPLLEGPMGSVITLLNWSPQQFNSTTTLLTVNVTGLSFKPSKVESIEHGVVQTKPIAGSSNGVTMSLPLASADFLLFHK